nr:PAS domain-containing protein [uncultured Noviherbaspirillum sp.]
MLDSRTAIFIAWGPELCLLYNDAYVTVLGDRHPSSLGKPLCSVWPEVWPKIQPLVTKVLSGQAFHYENAHFTLHRDEKEQDTWFTFSYTPLRDLNGNIHGFYCILEETTEHVQLRQRQHEETSRIFTLFESSPSFMAVLSGPQLRFEMANAAYLRFVGKRQLVGRSVKEVFPEINEQGYLDILDRVYATGEPFIGQRLPVALHRQSSEVLDIRYIDFVFQPMRDLAGKINGIFIEGYDITDHVNVEERGHNSERLALEAIRLQKVEKNLLSALLEAAPVGIAFADITGALTLVNAENRRIWGEHPMSENVDSYVVWKGWWADGSTRHGQKISPHEWGLARALRGENVVNDIIVIEPFGAPGTRRTVLLRATPIRDENGSVTNAVVTQTDISERVRNEAALRESEAKFRSITDAMPQMVWSALANGHHDYYNQQWYSFTGVPQGSTDGEGWNNMFHSEDQKRAWDTWSHCLQSGEPYEIEYRLRHHSGQYRWVLGRALPIRNDGGAIIRWMGTCTDIHEQKLSQVALKENEEQFRALAENIPQLAWMAGSDGSIFWYNDRWYAYTGTTFKEMQRWGWQKFQNPDYVVAVNEKFRECIRNGKVWEDTFEIKGADGSYRYFLSRAVPIRDEAGNITRWLGTNTDITDERDAAELLRQVDQRKDEFLAMLAHELRNPLAPITTAAQLLRFVQNDTARVHEISTIISRQAAHMTSLIDDLLDVSRVTRGLITLQKEAVDIKTVVIEAIEQARPLIEAKSHQIEVLNYSSKCTVVGDKKRLIQVMVNLLTNAARYTPNGGCISVSTNVADSQAFITVRDSGVGMSSKLLTRAFDLFVQGERTPDRSQGGLGIGLALVKNLVQLHGGTVTANSEGINKGTEVIVSLPLIEKENNHALSVANDDATSLSEAGLRIMLVDDNKDAAEVLAMLLQAVGHDVYVEYQASTALENAQTILPQVCLLDIGLPDMDGKELAKRLREIPGMEDAALAALTGYGQPQDREATKAAGFDKHFVKPAEIQVLIKWLRDCVS